MTVPLRAYAAGTKPGEKVGFNVAGDATRASSSRARSRRRRSAATRRHSSALAGFRPVKGKTYTVQIDANVFSGGGVVLHRTLTLVAT